MSVWILMKFEVEIPIKPRGKIDGAFLRCRARLPFIPQRGMFLVVLEGDDYRKVESVYWSKSDGFVVNFAFDEGASLKHLTTLGWKEDK
jgi:hypothetical protein